MRPIFVSYRRDDSEGEAGRLFGDLVAHFGEDSVFMDVAAIEAGRDIRKVIDESVANCGVLLAVIGKNWVEAKNSAGQRRLDDPSDFVRLETAAALKRDISVIPVLVRGASVPRADQLPEDLKDLAYRHGVELTHPRWNTDLQLLIKALRPHVGESKTAPGAQSQGAAAVLTAPAPAPPTARNVGAKTTPAAPRKPKALILAVMAAVLAIGAAAAYIMMLNHVEDLIPSITAAVIEPDEMKKFQGDNVEVKGYVSGNFLTGTDVKILNYDIPGLGIRLDGSPTDQRLNFIISSTLPICPGTVIRIGVEKKETTKPVYITEQYRPTLPTLTNVAGSLKQGDKDATVTLTGTGFIPGCTDVVVTPLNTVMVSTVNVKSSQSLAVKLSPSHTAPPTVNMAVRNPTGSSSTKELTITKK